MEQRSLISLVGRAYFSLMGAVALGSLACFPWMLGNVRTIGERVYLVEREVRDLDELKAWARSQPGVEKAELVAGPLEVRVTTEARALTPRPTAEQWIEQLRARGYGYRGMDGGTSRSLLGLSGWVEDARLLGVMLASMQVVFGILGGMGIRSLAGRGRALSLLLGERPGRALVLGLVGGCVLVVLGVLHHLIGTWGLGRPVASPWDTAGTMGVTWKLVFLGFGVLGAPVAEELFFRGYWFHRFEAAGFPRAGYVVTSLLFGAAHFTDPQHVPVIVLYGGVLAWLFRRARSLVAPVVAHAVNNGVAILAMVGM